jgi:hypothetical protein
MAFLAAARNGSLPDSVALSNRIELGELDAKVLGASRWGLALVVIVAAVVSAILIAFFRANTPFTLVAVIGVDLAALLIVLLWERTSGEN